MNETCETVTIKTENGPVVINKDDYDPKAHTPHTDKPKRTAAKANEPEAE